MCCREYSHIRTPAKPKCRNVAPECWESAPACDLFLPAAIGSEKSEAPETDADPGYENHPGPAGRRGVSSAAS